MEKNPFIGTDLGNNIFKIRLAISGTNKGKSGGARVITFVAIIEEFVYLTEIYLKSEHDSVDVDLVIEKLKHSGIL